MDFLFYILLGFFLIEFFVLLTFIFVLLLVLVVVFKSCEKGKNMNKICHIKNFIRDRKKPQGVPRVQNAFLTTTTTKYFFKKPICNS